MRVAANNRSQRGYTLLILLLGLVGLGGLVASDFTQSVKERKERERYEHNKRVLNEAKQALLQFAYDYPVTNQNGPGRLPCPDTDNDGTPNTPINCSTFIGRLPWNQPNLNLYDIRDADGQRLWYAVSTNFSTQEAGPLNSDTAGTITVSDQEGNVIYDGSVGNGVAAVILAPGPETDRNGVLQDRSVANGDDPFDTTADTDPGIVNATNYLDLFFGIEDNAALNQAVTNGFIYGEIDPLGADSVIVNDQLIVITVAEVMAVAEMAVLQTYRDALATYDQVIDTDVGAGNHYPWLFNYEVNDFGGGYPELDEYPTEPNFADEINDRLDNVGRVPSIYADYFTETDSQPIESTMFVDLLFSYPLDPDTVGFSQPSATCPSNPAVNCTTGNLEFDSADNRRLDVLSSRPVNNVVFTDLVAANMGQLSGTFVNDDSISVTRYFWDEEPVGNGFQQCPAGGDQLSDCNRDSGGNPDPGNTNDTASQVLRVTMSLNLNGAVDFDTDYSVDPTVTVTQRADNTRHAWIRGRFNGTEGDAGTLPVTITYDYDSFYLASFDVQASGDLEVQDLLDRMELTMRYDPVLPRWVFDDGWYDAVQLAYAPAYSPDVFGACVETVDCLQINNVAGNIDNKIALLTIAGQHNWNDDNAAGLADDIGDIFDLENDDIDNVFDIRAANGNDRILVLDEL